MANRNWKKLPVPEDTCPHIDRAIELAELIESACETNSNDSLKSRYVEALKAELEITRESNEMLREAGKYWYKKATGKSV